MLSDIKEKFLLGGFFLIMIFGSYLIVRVDRETKNSQEIAKNKIKVEISGAVKKPGIYEFEEGVKIEDILKSLELDERADISIFELNLKTTLLDGQKIYIPFKGELQSKKININIASKEELESLPGIGPVLAKRIIQYRQSQPFKVVEDLKKVRGVGEKTFEKVAPFISVQ